MKATFVKSYRSKNTGTVTFMYKVTGTQEEIAEYIQTQGTNYRPDENGNPLFFTINYAGPVCNLLKTQRTSKYIADMSELDKYTSLANQTSGALQAAIAAEAARTLLGHAKAVQAPPAQNAQAPVPPVAESDANLGTV